MTNRYQTRKRYCTCCRCKMPQNGPLRCAECDVVARQISEAHLLGRQESDATDRYAEKLEGRGRSISAMCR